MTTPDKITRFSPYAVDGGSNAYGQMEEDFHGDYVNYEDHQSAILALQADHTRLVKEAVEAEGEAVNALPDDYPRPVAVAYNDDKSYSKHDRCQHDLTMYEDCEQCLAAAIRARGVTP